jgi:hypothetical protein
VRPPAFARFASLGWASQPNLYRGEASEGCPAEALAKADAAESLDTISDIKSQTSRPPKVYVVSNGAADPLLGGDASDGDEAHPRHPADDI